MKRNPKLSLGITQTKSGAADTNRGDITINNIVLSATLSTAG